MDYGYYELKVEPIDGLPAQDDTHLNNLLDAVENRVKQTNSNPIILTAIKELREHAGFHSENIISHLREINDYASCFLSHTGSSLEDGEWAYWDGDLKAFSKLYPEVKFTLSFWSNREFWEGWKAYIVNGKLQLEKVKVGNFNPNKLM